MTRLRTPLAALVALIAAASALLLVGAPAAGAQSYNSPESGIAVDESDLTFAPGEQFTVTGTGFAPFSEVDVYFKSTPVLLGTLTADSVGAIQGAFNVPAGIATGDHHVELQGTDGTGSPRVLSLAVGVTSTGTPPSALSFTGGTVAPLAGAALLMIGLGLTAVRFGRRRVGVDVPVNVPVDVPV